MLHIDIVDDDSYICVQIERYVQSVFRNFNKEVNCYSDGKEFLEDLNETGGPDIVFMDIEMPSPNGFEVAESQQNGVFYTSFWKRFV